MSEIIYTAIGGSIGALSGILGTYIMAKRYFSDDKIMQKIDLVLSEVSSNTELQQKVYILGGIVGKGIRDGVGMDKMIPKRKGGVEGIIYDLIGNFIGNRIQGQEQQQQPVDVTPRPIQKW